LTKDPVVLGAWNELYGKFVELMTAKEESLDQKVAAPPSNQQT
jgi:hypothetical protein